MTREQLKAEFQRRKDAANDKGDTFSALVVDLAERIAEAAWDTARLRVEEEESS